MNIVHFGDQTHSLFIFKVKSNGIVHKFVNMENTWLVVIQFRLFNVHNKTHSNMHYFNAIVYTFSC